VKSTLRLLIQLPSLLLLTNLLLKSEIVNPLIGNTKQYINPILWSNADPSVIEQDALEHINRLRANPILELTRIFERYPVDIQISALLKPYQQRTISGALETLDVTSTRLISSITLEFNQRKKVFPMTSAPLCIYPLLQKRAEVLKELIYTTELKLKVVNPNIIFSPTYSGTQQPPNYLFSPYIYFNNTFSDTPQGSWNGPSATNSTVTFGPYGGNESMITWSDLSPEGGINLDAWCAFLFLSQTYPALFAVGPYTPSLTMGNGRLAGIDLSERLGNPGKGDSILTIDIADPQFFTSGSDLPFGALNTLFVTGVVYEDINSNGIYDLGEGVSGVTVSCPSSPYQAVTTQSGGYTLPVLINTGKAVLTFQSLSVNQSRVVSINQDNVKADLVISFVSDAPHLMNLSCRSFVGDTKNPLVAGFVISGSQNESILIRGIGPTLSKFGVQNVLLNPSLIVYNATGDVVAQNTGWFSNPDPALLAQVTSQVGAFTLPAFSLDCALLLNLNPGSYTTQILSSNSSFGQAMIEIYHVPST